MRKAQVQTQIFIYILAILVAGLILFYGYGAIKDFITRGERLSLVNLENDLKDNVQALSTSFERVKIETLDVPGNYVKLCLLDLSKPADDFSVCRSEYNPVVCESWKDPEIEENVFLVDDEGATIKLGQGYIGDIILDNPGCFDVINSKIKIKFTGASNNKVKLEVQS